MKVIKYPDPVLTTPCSLVEESEFNSNLDALIDNMIKVMIEEKGMGLAANQVGISKRLFILKDLKGKIHEFINPRIIEIDGIVMLQEGCLSAPGAFVQVSRAKFVTVTAKNRKGEEFTIIAQDLEAVCVQHEIDHLDGIFYLDKTNRQQRRAAYRLLGFKE